MSNGMEATGDAERARLLPLVGAFNFRDLGGYPTVDGRRTRWGRLFRSDTLGELTEDDLRVLRDLGLATVLDLRSPSEAERDGRGLLATVPVRYLNLPVIPEGATNNPAVPEPIDGDMGARYLWYLEAGRDSVVQALGMIADEANLPLVFHCTAGKDRTGVLAALVLSLLGVEREVIVADYVETQARMHLIIERLRNHPVYGKAVGDDLPPNRFAAQAASMVSFLGGLDERHGGPTAWLLQAGLDEGAVERLQAGLLER